MCVIIVLLSVAMGYYFLNYRHWSVTPFSLLLYKYIYFYFMHFYHTHIAVHDVYTDRLFPDGIVTDTSYYYYYYYYYYCTGVWKYYIDWTEIKTNFFFYNRFSPFRPFLFYSTRPLYLRTVCPTKRHVEVGAYEFCRIKKSNLLYATPFNNTYYYVMFARNKRRLVMRKTYETKCCPRCTPNVQLFFFFLFSFTRYSLLLLLLCRPLRDRHVGMHKGLPVQVTAGIRGSLPEEGVFRLGRIPALIPNVSSRPHTIRPATRGNVPGCYDSAPRFRVGTRLARPLVGTSIETLKCSGPRHVKQWYATHAFSHRKIIA
jgi:hypothetical protein